MGREREAGAAWEIEDAEKSNPFFPWRWYDEDAEQFVA